ncbi:hypothetical protein H5410_032495 [Solanum commersonii]|uniref:Uncharacterized protein n=1 Tax=Solanum commersonii TaxID=4109 RepID=A0A9J5YMD0_SOLCO|nr:hypothetical protein H5410_032495 [Solanum commersonii]
MSQKVHQDELNEVSRLIDSQDTLSTKFDGHSYLIWKFHFKLEAKASLVFWNAQRLYPQKTKKKRLGRLTMAKLSHDLSISSLLI